jgi:hypothetical protein
MDEKQKKSKFVEDTLLEQQSLEAKLNVIHNAVEETEKQDKNSEKKEEQDLLDELITKGVTTKEQVEQWKNEYNDRVFVAYFDSRDTFIYRYLSRTDFNAIYSELSSVQKNSNMIFDEAIVARCLLYPKYTAEFKALSPAGTIATLSKLIQFSSHIIPDDLAISLIHKI